MIGVNILTFCVAGIDTDELDSHIENFEEETVEFLVKVEEKILGE